METKNKKSWWDNNAINRIAEFKRWLGRSDALSRKILAKHIRNNKYNSILDCGFGLCGSRDIILKYSPQIEYYGIDSCNDLVKLKTSEGIPNLFHRDIENNEFEDSRFDIVFCRHVLEHLPYYEEALTEMIRTAKKEVSIIWFNSPKNSDDEVGLHATEPNLYSNTYNFAKLEKFILNNKKVGNLEFIKLKHKDESLLHIFLKDGR